MEGRTVSAEPDWVFIRNALALMFGGCLDREFMDKWFIKEHEGPVEMVFVDADEVQP